MKGYVYEVPATDTPHYEIHAALHYDVQKKKERTLARHELPRKLRLSS